MNNTIDNLKKVRTYLETMDVRGRENSAKLVICCDTIDQIAQDLMKEEAESDDTNVPAEASLPG